MTRQIPAKTITHALLRSWPLPQTEGGDKEDRGRVLVVAGMRTVPGAAVLAATAALRAGAGKLQVAGPESVSTAIAMEIPEALVMPFAEAGDGAPALTSVEPILEYATRAHALVVGPGMAPNESCSAFVRKLLRGVRVPTVVDASALFACSEDPALLEHFSGNAILTPHATELSHLTGLSKDEIDSEPERCAVETARRFNAVVALKGATTYIASPDGRMHVNTFGHDGLATSGSGDVLAGVIGGLLARGATATQAAVWGVALHALAGAALGERIGTGFLARELLPEIPRQMSAI